MPTKTRIARIGVSLWTPRNPPVMENPPDASPLERNERRAKNQSRYMPRSSPSTRLTQCSPLRGNHRAIKNLSGGLLVPVQLVETAGRHPWRFYRWTATNCVIDLSHFG